LSANYLNILAYCLAWIVSLWLSSVRKPCRNRNGDSAHPFENHTPLSNFLEMLAILLIPAALCYTFGKMLANPCKLLAEPWDLESGWSDLNRRPPEPHSDWRKGDYPLPPFLCQFTKLRVGCQALPTLIPTSCGLDVNQEFKPRVSTSWTISSVAVLNPRNT